MVQARQAVRRWLCVGERAANTPAAVALSLFLCASITRAQVLNGPGADVIVGDLPDTTSYGRDPAMPNDANAIFGYDIGTTSCNVGGVPLVWEQSTNLHPVISQNLYRLWNGRFEQIGMSWGKHGFFALSGDICNLGCAGSTGVRLGVGCSDPYDFGINGTQSSLGPRSIVNPFTGGFVYQPSAWPVLTGVTSRRLQVRAGDIDPASFRGAMYFGEGLYITPDDALAGNAWNNASYRQMVFGTDANRSSSFAPGAATRRLKPAIFAWQEMDPAVRIVPVDVPGDGQVWVGARATSIGAGAWQYEYAVQNMTSHRGIQAVGVPVLNGPAAGGVVLGDTTGPRFHSGEAWSNQPWQLATESQGVIAFGETFATSPLGNALRWGTLRRFGFTSTAAPAAGAIRLELFGPGSGAWAGLARVYAGVLTPGGGGGATPPGPALGNECSSPIIAHAGINGVCLFGATASASPTSCASAPAFEADVWLSYTYSDTCTGALLISTCGSDFDTHVSVYGPGGCGSAPLACNDNSSGSCTGVPYVVNGGVSTGVSRVSVTATPGATYLIRVASPLTAGPRVGGWQGVLTIVTPRCVTPPGACCLASGACLVQSAEASCAGVTGQWQGSGSVCVPNTCPQPPAPVNDLCVDAIALSDSLAGGGGGGSGGGVVRGTNVFATTDALPACEGGARDVWYSYTPARTEPVSIDLCLSGAGDLTDSTLQVLTACMSGGVVVGCNDDFCAGRSSVTATLSAGARYLVRVAGFSGQSGSFTIRVVGGGGLGDAAPGACCRGATCSVLSSAVCAQGASGPAGVRFVGAGSACNAAGNVQMPCCLADINQNGSVAVQDLFDFLTLWFVPSPLADVGGAGNSAPTVQSIFTYLNAWFGGC